MGAGIVTSSSLAIMAFMAASFLATAAAEAGSVPAVYVFGDSLADVGNNNYLLTLLKADFPHNGMDYPGRKATGRFSNGKNFPDFFADKLGLATSPPYLAVSSSSNANYVNGVNFASGGAGVSNSTNKDQCISFDKQIEYYSKVYASLARSLGQAQAANHLAKSIFAVTIGSNDIIHYARPTPPPRPRTPLSNSWTRSSSPSLANCRYVNTRWMHLVSTDECVWMDAWIMDEQSLYDLGARKVLFLGTGPVGCCLSLRELSSTKDCSAEANGMSVQYNKAAESVLRGMATQHPDLHYAIFNSSAALLRYINQPAAYGGVLRIGGHERQDRLHTSEQLLRQPDGPRLLGLLPPDGGHRAEAHHHRVRRLPRHSSTPST